MTYAYRTYVIGNNVHTIATCCWWTDGVTLASCDGRAWVLVFIISSSRHGHTRRRSVDYSRTTLTDRQTEWWFIMSSCSACYVSEWYRLLSIRYRQTSRRRGWRKFGTFHQMATPWRTRHTAH